MTPNQTPEQRLHLRRILIVFVLEVVLLPLAAIGGVWALLLLPMLAAGVVGLRSAIALRRTQQAPHEGNLTDSQ